MAKPLRIEYEGALYNITARGNEQMMIYNWSAKGRTDQGSIVPSQGLTPFTTNQTMILT